MRCSKCKSAIKEGSKFCRVCGQPVKKRKKWPLAIAVILILGAVGIAAYLIPGLQKANPSSDDQTAADGSEYGYVVKETVSDRLNARESKSVPSVADVGAELKDRGFGNLEITSHYDMDGAITDEKALDSKSDETHPVYGAMFQPSEDEIWMIYVINGQYMASPIVADGVERPYDKQLIIVENDYVTSYDSVANEFIVAVPDPSEVAVEKVGRIDADTLVNLDVGAIQWLD